MPNWVATKIKFTSITDEQFDRIVEQYCTNGCLDFEKLIPMPDNVFRQSLTPEDRRKYPGDLNWYDWSIDHWGTKWNASDGEIDRPNHTLLYQTAWSYAEPPVQELAERLRDDGTLSGEAMINVYAMNEDIACGAEMQFYDGDGYWNEESEYGEDRFWKICEDLWGIDRAEYEEETEGE